MEAGETAGEAAPHSTTASTAQNPPASPTTNRSSPQSARPITTAGVGHKPTNEEPRSQGVTKGSDFSGDSGIGGGDGEGIGGSGGGGGGFASLARKLTSKGKGNPPANDGVVGVTTDKQQNGCPEDLDLPLGSEAYSISSPQANGIDSTSRISVGPDAVSSHKSAAQSGMMGWQSFNSDVSTSAASTASLDMLLNDRLMDPEEVLFNLGFGGPQPVAYVPSLTRIPQRFLQAAASRAVGDDGLGDPHTGLGGLSSPEDGSGSTGGGGGGGGGGAGVGGFAAAAVQAMQHTHHGHGAGQMGRKRTGGFCVSGVLFFPCHGYVDLARLVRVYNIPLVFFNREGSKCYRRVRLRSVRAATADGEDLNTRDGGQGAENNVTVERRKSNRKSKRTIRRRKTGGKSMHQSRSWIESVVEEDGEKASETKAQKEKERKESVGKSVRIKTCTSVEEYPPSENTSPNGTDGIEKRCEPQLVKRNIPVTKIPSISEGMNNELVLLGKKQEPENVSQTTITILCPETMCEKENLSPMDSVPLEKNEKPRRKKFFDLSYVKMAAKKLGDVMSGKLSRSRMYDLSTASVTDETGQYVSDIIPEKIDNDGDISEVTLKKIISQSSESPSHSLRVPDKSADIGCQRLESSDPGNLGSLSLDRRERTGAKKGLRIPELKRHTHTSSHPNLVSKLCMTPLLGSYVSRWSGVSSKERVCSETSDKLCSSDSAINRPDIDAQSLSGSQMEMSPRCHSLEPDDRPIVEEVISPEVSSVVCNAQNSTESRVESFDTNIVCNIALPSLDSSPVLPSHSHHNIGSSNVNDIAVGEYLKSNLCSNHNVDDAYSTIDSTHSYVSCTTVSETDQNSLGTIEQSSTLKEGLVQNISKHSQNKTFTKEAKFEEIRPEVATLTLGSPMNSNMSNASYPNSDISIDSCHSDVTLPSKVGTSLEIGAEIENRSSMKPDKEPIISVEDDTAAKFAKFENDSLIRPAESLDNVRSDLDINAIGDLDICGRDDLDITAKGGLDVTVRGDLDITARGDPDITARGDPDIITESDLDIAAKDEIEDAVNDSVDKDLGICGSQGDSIVKDEDIKANGTSDAQDEDDSTDQTEGTDVAPAGSLGPEALIESVHGNLGSANVLSMLAPSTDGMGFLVSLGLPGKEEEEDNSSEVSSEYGHSLEDRLQDFDETETGEGAQDLPEDQSSMEDEDQDDDDDEEEEDESEFEDEFDDDYDDYISGDDVEEEDLVESGNSKDIGFGVKKEDKKLTLGKVTATNINMKQVKIETLAILCSSVLNETQQSSRDSVDNTVERRGIDSFWQQRGEQLSPPPDFPACSNEPFTSVNKHLNNKNNYSSPSKPVTFHLSLENLNTSMRPVHISKLSQRTSLQQRHPTTVEKQHSFSPVTPEITLTDTEGFSVPKSHSSQNFRSFSSQRAKSVSASRSFDLFPHLKMLESSRDTQNLGSLPRLLSASSSSLSSNSSNYQLSDRISPWFLRSATPTTALFLKLRKTAPLSSSSYAGSFLSRSPSSDSSLPKGQKARNSLTVETLNSLRAVVEGNGRSEKPNNEIPVKTTENFTTDTNIEAKQIGNSTAEVTNPEDGVRHVATSDLVVDKVVTDGILTVRAGSKESTTSRVNVPDVGEIGVKDTPFPPVKEECDSFKTPNFDEKVGDLDTNQTVEIEQGSQNLQNNPASTEMPRKIPPLGLAYRKRQERNTIDFDPRIPTRKFGAYSSFASAPLPEDDFAEFEAPTSASCHAPAQLPPDVGDRRQSLPMRRRTSTGCITARQGSIPALASSSSAEWARLVASRSPSDDLDRLSAADQAEVDMSNVSTSSDEDSESDSEDKRAGEKWDEIFSRPSSSVIFGL